MIEFGLGLLNKLEALLDKPSIRMTSLLPTDSAWKTLVIGFTLAQFTFERVRVKYIHADLVSRIASVP